MVVHVRVLACVHVHRRGLERAVLRVSAPIFFSWLIFIVRWRLAVCTSACQNGGTCSAPNTCTCTSSWTGATCTTREIRLFPGILILTLPMIVVAVCPSGCYNGGWCSSPGLCTCSGWWTGGTCQTRMSSPDCSEPFLIRRYSSDTFRFVLTCVFEWWYL